MSVGAQMGRKFSAMGRELSQSRRTAVTRGAQAIVNPVRDEIRRVTRDNRLSGVGKSGARVGARYDVRGQDEALVRATGPLHLVERDTKAHEIQPKARRRKSGRTGVRLADGSVRRSVRHPGTKGQRPFEKGIEKGRPKAVRELRGVTTNAVVRGFRA